MGLVLARIDVRGDGEVLERAGGTPAGLIDLVQTFHEAVGDVVDLGFGHGCRLVDQPVQAAEKIATECNARVGQLERMIGFDLSRDDGCDSVDCSLVEFSHEELLCELH